MKFCPVVPEICRGQVHGARKERRIIIIIMRKGAKTISLQTLFGGLNNNKKRSKNNGRLNYQSGDKVRNGQSGHKIQMTFYNKARNYRTGDKSSGDLL